MYVKELHVSVRIKIQEREKNELLAGQSEEWSFEILRNVKIYVEHVTNSFMIESQEQRVEKSRLQQSKKLGQCLLGRQSLLGSKVGSPEC